MESTTIKLSVHTRDRLKSFGGATYEDTVVAALDALEATQFWSQVDAAVRCREHLSPAERALRTQVEADVDAAFDGID